MNNSKKEWVIISIIVIIVVIGYVIFLSNKVTYWKHQHIGYEQYKEEDCRQARIYNSTFATSEEEFLKRIEKFSEKDKEIAREIYEIKPEITKLKESIRFDLEKIKQNPNSRNILQETKTTLITNHINSIEEYVQRYNIKGSISQLEYLHLYDLFVSPGNGLQIAEFANTLTKYDITVSSTNSTNRENEEDINKRIVANRILLKEIKTKYNELLSSNLEYQDIIITDGIKNAMDYLIGDEI